MDQDIENFDPDKDLNLDDEDKITKMEEELENMVYKYIVVEFDSEGKVESVFFDAEKCDSKEYKKVVDSYKITPNKVTTPSVLPTITAAETNYIAFDIASIDYHIELYGYLQTKENKHTIKDCDDFILNHSLYDQQQYYKPYSYGRTNYNTLPTYIRNAIDHPDSSHTYTDEELRKSIEFLIQLLK